MGLYRSFVMPRMLDFAMRQKPIMRQRARVVPLAHGRVLEVGVGSGLNLAFYDRGKLEKLWALEPSPELRAMTARRADEAGLPLEVVAGGAEQIPLDDGAVTTVVTTYTLCTIPEIDRALAEIHRVLEPGGRLLFAEHGRAPDRSVARWQDRLNPLWRKIGGGCNLNRPIPEMIASAGFDLTSLDSLYLPGPRMMTFNFWGQATRA